MLKSFRLRGLSHPLQLPDHLRYYKHCLLDQLIPADYAPIVIFYPNQDPSNHFRVPQKLALLKQSLSETLSRFFPLAGTIRDDLSNLIDCDDQGARFTTATVKSCLMGEFLDQSPNLKLIAKFLPCGPTRKGTADSCVTNIQASEFECGGICIGVCISHRVLDGASLSTFLRTWADFASPSTGERKIVLPDFSASTLFPANDWRLKDASMAMWGSMMKEVPFVTKRFVFNGSKIEILKDMATRLMGDTRPTRVETVSGFIWKCAMVASSERCGFKRPSLITHLVNLRRRATPNLPEESIGNLTWVASAKCGGGERENLEFCELVDEVRKCVSRIDGDFVRRLRGHGGFEIMRECLGDIEGFGCEEDNVDHFGFTRWCKLGFYDVDFGWGRPVWVSSIDASGPF
ncbi:hypothetical protein OROMI_033449 [Orobanche minor]